MFYFSSVNRVEACFGLLPLNQFHLNRITVLVRGVVTRLLPPSRAQQALQRQWLTIMDQRPPWRQCLSAPI